MILDLRLPRRKSILINIPNRSIETVQELFSIRSLPLVSIVESHCQRWGEKVQVLNYLLMKYSRVCEKGRGEERGGGISVFLRVYQ